MQAKNFIAYSTYVESSEHPLNLAEIYDPAKFT
jgi:hypothetical protein